MPSAAAAAVDGDAALAQAWTAYSEAIAESYAAISATPRFGSDPQHRAAAHHVLLEAQAMAYNWAVAPRLDRPRAYVHTSWNTYLYTLGQNSPDNYYCCLFLDGTRTYRMTGRIGQVCLAALQVFDRLLGHPESRSIGNYALDDYAGPDGTFDVVLSATEHEGAWIKLSGDSRYHFLLLRRWMADWFEDPGTLDIEVVDTGEGGGDPPDLPMWERVAAAADVVKYLTANWAVELYDFYLSRTEGARNALALVPGESIDSSLAGNSFTNYAFGVFDLAPDEALILELDPPPSVYWSFQLGDVWSKSLDPMYRQTDVNMRRATVDADGKVRVVVAHRDPGVANWLDTTGRREGSLVFRNYRSPVAVVPETRVTKAAALWDHLPATTTTVTPEQREAALENRRRGLLRLWGPIA
ncbi:MAG: DUF1214 domain-containing protein [Mycobacteriales bacterium]